MTVWIPVLIVGVIGLIAGVGLSLASKFMAVPVDETETKVRECLPGANCGACGYSGCDGYAAAIAKGEAEPDKCAPGGAATAAAIGEVLGVEVKAGKPQTAFIACNGSREITEMKYTYSGLQSCAAANLMHNGPVSCEYGCIGFGDCMRACPFGAIRKGSDGRLSVCEDVCVACGKCAAACPKGLIRLIPKGEPVHVLCANKQKGAAVVKNCKVSCIACKMCEKACPNGAITVVDNLAVIDGERCTGCGKCKEACKRGVLV